MTRNIGEFKKELLESIVEESLEDAELINKPDVLTLQDALECVKQYENICKTKTKNDQYHVQPGLYIT